MEKLFDRFALAVGHPAPRWLDKLYSVAWSIVMTLGLFATFFHQTYVAAGEWLNDRSFMSELPPIGAIMLTGIALGWLQMAHRMAVARRSEILSR